MSNTTPPQTPWQKAADTIFFAQNGWPDNQVIVNLRQIVEQACKEHAARLEKENAELRLRVSDLSRRLGFVMGSLEGLRLHDINALTRKKLNEAIESAKLMEDATHPTPESK